MKKQYILTKIMKLLSSFVSSFVTCLSLPRYDGHPLCLSGDLPRGVAGEEAEPVSSGRCPHGHAGQPGVHSLLCLLSLSGL